MSENIGKSDWSKIVHFANFRFENIIPGLIVDNLGVKVLHDPYLNINRFISELRQDLGQKCGQRLGLDQHTIYPDQMDC